MTTTATPAAVTAGRAFLDAATTQINLAPQRLDLDDDMDTLRTALATADRDPADVASAVAALVDQYNRAVERSGAQSAQRYISQSPLLSRVVAAVDRATIVSDHQAKIDAARENLDRAERDAEAAHAAVNRAVERGATLDEVLKLRDEAERHPDLIHQAELAVIDLQLDQARAVLAAPQDRYTTAARVETDAADAAAAARSEWERLTAAHAATQLALAAAAAGLRESERHVVELQRTRDATVLTHRDDRARRLRQLAGISEPAGVTGDTSATVGPDQASVTTTWGPSSYTQRALQRITSGEDIPTSDEWDGDWRDYTPRETTR